MTRYIDADALMETVREYDYPLVTKHNSHGNGMFTIGIQQAIDEQPTADVVEVVHGKWLFIANGVEAPECSVCGWAVDPVGFKNRSGLPPYHKYCGHCGARMDGDT